MYYENKIWFDQSEKSMLYNAFKAPLGPCSEMVASILFGKTYYTYSIGPREVAEDAFDAMRERLRVKLAHTKNGPEWEGYSWASSKDLNDAGLGKTTRWISTRPYYVRVNGIIEGTYVTEYLNSLSKKIKKPRK